MDFINLSASMTMLDLVRYLLQDTNNSFSFYSGKLSVINQEEPTTNNSQLRHVCQYICKKVREEWRVHNIGIISVDDKELMICATSPDASAPAEIVSFIVEAVAISIANLTQVKAKQILEATEDDESLVKDIQPELVQVNATMKEISERIEQFTRYKRAQANTNNVLDFCGVPGQNQCCARVDAILVRKKDSSSHMAVRNVLDRYTSKNNSEIPAPTASISSKTFVAAPSQTQHPVCDQPSKGVAQKGEKRTYDVASLELLLNQVKKQPKT